MRRRRSRWVGAPQMERRAGQRRSVRIPQDEGGCGHRHHPRAYRCRPRRPEHLAVAITLLRRLGGGYGYADAERTAPGLRRSRLCADCAIPGQSHLATSARVLLYTQKAQKRLICASGRLTLIEAMQARCTRRCWTWSRRRRRWTRGAPGGIRAGCRGEQALL